MRLGGKGEARAKGKKHRGTDNSMVAARGEGVGEGQEGKGGLRGGGKDFTWGATT